MASRFLQELQVVRHGIKYLFGDPVVLIESFDGARLDRLRFLFGIRFRPRQTPFAKIQSMLYLQVS